jgi:hypothetical protein
MCLDPEAAVEDVMNPAHRTLPTPDLLVLPGSVGIRGGEIVTGLFEDGLSCDEQRAFGTQLMQRAESFRQRMLRTPLVIEGEAS